jgi:TonB family protein
VTADGGEFFILMPSKPAIYVINHDAPLMIKEELLDIDKEYVASTYHGRAVYLVHIYKTPDPKGALKNLLENNYPPLIFEREITLGRYKGRQYRRNGAGFYSSVQGFRTRHYVYVVEVAARDKDDPAVSRFLSSLRLGGENSTAGAIEVTSETRSTPDPSPAPAALEELSQKTGVKEVTRKAVLLLKPEPPFTKEGRKARTRGAVVLRLVLSSSGQTTGIRVVQGLGHGLTEGAVEAAKYIRFLPAEKDGRPVSQYMQVEYHFEVR